MANGPPDTGPFLSSGLSVDTNEASRSLTRDDAAIYVDGLTKTFCGGEDAVTADDTIEIPSEKA